MSGWNLAAKSNEERDKVNVDLAAAGVAYKERLNMPIIADQVRREHQPPESSRSALSGNGRIQQEVIDLKTP